MGHFWINVTQSVRQPSDQEGSRYGKCPVCAFGARQGSEVSVSMSGAAGKRLPEPPEDEDGAAALFRTTGRQVELLRERADVRGS